MSKRASQSWAPRGFTLIELVLVAATVAVMAAIAVPRMTSASLSYRAEMAARRIAADIELARQEAMATSSTRTLAFSAASLSYYVLESGSADGGTGAYAVNLKQAPYEAASMKVKFAAVPPPTVLKFDGFGKPNAGASIVVTAGGPSKTVAVDSHTGRAVVR